MDGKEKCRYLRSVRKTIAEENNIDMDFEECTYEGECRGTCPKCDSELEYLNREIEKKLQAGENVYITAEYEEFTDEVIDDCDDDCMLMGDIFRVFTQFDFES
ncbi:MAG: hypothetical protein ACI4QZ_09550 [Eubacteriales bacterium]